MKKKDNRIDLIFFTNHRISNENSIFPITNLIDYNKKITLYCMKQVTKIKFQIIQKYIIKISF